jgi:hypothetical protein
MSEKIPGSRVPFLDTKTSLVSREWYRYFNDLFGLTGSGSNNISLLDVQTEPTVKEPVKSRREVQPYLTGVGASPYLFINKTSTEVDVLVTGGTLTSIDFSRDYSAFYTILANRAMVRLSQYDAILITYTAAPSLVIIPR